MQRFLPALALAAFAATAASAATIPWKITNATSSAIKEIYLSLPGEEKWGENRLTGTINPGEYVNAPITNAGDVCEFDLKFVYADGETTEDRSYDLCENPDYKIEDEQ